MQLMPLGALKAYVCLTAVSVAGLELVQPAVGAVEYTAYGVILLAAVVGLLDAVVNDILPDRYEAKLASDWKHPVFFLLAVAQLSLMYTSVVYDQVGWHFFRYAVDAAGAVMVAVLDLRARINAARAPHDPDPLPGPVA